MLNHERKQEKTMETQALQKVEQYALKKQNIFASSKIPLCASVHFGQYVYWFWHYSRKQNRRLFLYG